MSVNLTEVSDIYAKLEELGTGTIDTYFNEHDLSGKDKATIISSAITTMITTAVQSQLQGEMNDAQISQTEAQTLILDAEKEKADIEVDLITLSYEIGVATKQDKISTSGYNKLKVESEKNVIVGSETFKINQAQYTSENVEAQKDLTIERKTQLIESVIYNNWYRGIDVLGDWYAMHVSNGGTVTTAMSKPIYEGVQALMLSDTNYTFTFDTNVTVG